MVKEFKKLETLQIRLTEDLAELLNEYYPELTGTNEELTNTDFLKCVINRALSNAKAIKDAKEQTERELTAKFEVEKSELINDFQTVSDELATVQAEISEIKKQSNDFQRQIFEAEKKASLKENQIIVNLHHLVNEDLKLYVSDEKFQKSFEAIKSTAIDHSTPTPSNTIQNIISAFFMGWTIARRPNDTKKLFLNTLIKK